MSKNTWDNFKKSSEYKLWEDLFRVAKEYGINEDTYFKKTDLSGEYWEPFFDRLYKMGSMLGFTKKLKEIRIDWMRPILYFGAQSTGIIEFDGRTDKVNKGAIANAILVKFSFKGVINAIENFANLDEKNFHKEYNSFKKDIKYYFTQLSKFVKDGFLTMHNHVKLILKPLLDLRRGAYRLFALEQMEKNNKHLTMFNDAKDLSIFLTSSRDFFQWEKYKQSKDPEGDKLEEFINQDTARDKLVYHFSSDIRPKIESERLNPYATNAAFRKDMEMYESKNKKEGYNQNKNTLVLPKIKKKKEKKEEKNYNVIIFPNILNLDQPQPTRLKHEAYQIEFENGLNSMIDYLNSHQNKDFPYIIDSHKIFVNIKYIPNGTKEPATNFYLNQLTEQIEQLKEKCYEMKLNGLSRVLMPITENVDLIKIIKNVFDLHVIIDNSMGNYLLYEQYMFIHDSLQFLTTTNYSEQFEILRNRDFMEENVPRYIIFCFLFHSAEILNKMRKYYKEVVGRPFVFEDSYQISEYDLMNIDNELIYSYEIYGLAAKLYNDVIKEKKKKYQEEAKQFGRFWISEGFFKKEDKNLWLQAIDLLSEINILVREDIRDYIITGKKKEDFDDHDNLNLSSSKNNSSFLDQNSSISGISKTKTAKKGKKQLKPISKKKSINKTDSKIKKNKRKHSSRRYSFATTSENYKLPKDINNLRPPSVWNFPVHRVEKIIIDGNKKEIRNVDPTLCYKDGRVDKFLKLFDEIYQNAMEYLTTSSVDLWDYFYSKCLKALKISYTTFKELKAEEEIKRQMEEELKKQQEEQERQEEERERELERLKIKKKGEGEIPPEEINKTANKTEKKKEKTDEKRVISGKKRLSSAKPSKELSKRVTEKKGTNRIQSTKNK